MRVIVCGGRDFSSPAQVWVALDRLNADLNITDLMHGGARGVDTFAKEWGHARGLRVWVCKAEWEKYGNAAGAMRNCRMADWGPDLVIAFPGGKGTANMVAIAKARKIPVKTAH